MNSCLRFRFAKFVLVASKKVLTPVTKKSERQTARFSKGFEF